MNPLKYDKVEIYPYAYKAVWKIIWYKKKFLQFKVINGRFHIKINKLKAFKTLEIDELDMMFLCRNCTIKYGELIKGKKIEFVGGNDIFCPICNEGI